MSGVLGVLGQAPFCKGKQFTELLLARGLTSCAQKFVLESSKSFLMLRGKKSQGVSKERGIGEKEVYPSVRPGVRPVPVSATLGGKLDPCGRGSAPRWIGVRPASKIEWTRAEEALTVVLPAEKPCAHALVPELKGLLNDH